MSRQSALAILIIVLAVGTLCAQSPQLRIYDVQAEALRGNITPSQGRVSNYLATIRNNYSGSVGGFLVQLVSDGTVLGSSYVQSIVAGGRQDVLITWTPQYEQVYEVYARTTMAGDLNAANDSTQTVTIDVQPLAVKLSTLGGVTEPLQIPLDFSARNSVCDNLYLQSELNYSGVITQLILYNSFPAGVNRKRVKLWLGASSASTLSVWSPFADLTQVYDGEVDFPAGDNAIQIILQQPFYLPPGSNLVLRSNRVFDMLTYPETYAFRAVDVPTFRGQIKTSQNLLDPANPGEDYTNNLSELPQAGFLFAPETGAALFDAVPEELLFGSVRMDFSHTRKLHLNNIGSLPLTITNIAIQAPVGDFVLQPLPDLPLVLQPAQGLGIEVYFQPQTAALQTRSLLVSCGTQTYTVILKGSGFDPAIHILPRLENFDAVEIGSLPPDFSALVDSSYPHAYVTTVNTASHSAPHSAEIYNYFDSAATLFLVLPPVADSIPINQLRLNFWYHGYFNSSLQIGVMDDPRNPATFILLGQITQGYSWAPFLFPLTDYEGMGRYIAFKYGSGSLSKLTLDDIIIERVPAADLTALNLSGEILISQVDGPVTHTLTLRNLGTQTQSDYSVQLLAAGSLVCSVAGIPLEPGQQAQLPLTWEPFTSGDWELRASIVMPADAWQSNNLSPAFHVWVDGASLYVLGSGAEHYPIPFDTGQGYSLYETIIPEAEIQQAEGFSGSIERLWLYAYNHTQPIPYFPIQVWLAGTLQGDLEQDWIPAGDMDLVFEGGVDMEGGSGPVLIELRSQFMYDGGNLALLVFQPYWSALTSSNYFLGQTSGANRSRRYLRDNPAPPIPNPYNPPDPTPSQLSGRYPRLGFAHTNSVWTGGSVLISVTDQSNLPLAGAAIRFRYTSRIGATGDGGSFYFGDLAPGAYQVVVSKPGYASRLLYVNVQPGSEQEISCVLISVESDDPVAPGITSTALLGNNPNPFSANTRIEFSLKSPAPVSVAIYNLRGQLVRRLEEGQLPSGNHVLNWDGADAQGNQVAAGIYLYRFQAGDVSCTRKMLRISQ